MSRLKFLISLALLLGCFAFTSKKESASPFTQFHPGYYVTDSGKVSGLIRFNYTNYRFFDFKKDAAGSKEKMSVAECSGFVVDRDTFEVIHGIELWNGFSTTRVDAAFARVAVKGTISVYEVFTKVTVALPDVPISGAVALTSSLSGSASTFLVQKRGQSGYLTYHGGTPKDQKSMAPLFADHPDLPAFGDAMTQEMLLSIVRAYNEGRNSW